MAILPLLYFGISHSQKNKDDDPLPVEETLAILAAPMTSWPIKRSAKDRWLDEMESKVSHNDAFFIKQWDTFDFVEIKHKVYPHSIGARIPLVDQDKYRKSVSSKQVEHTEYIEYPLGFEYATLQFDFGIDDLSFPCGVNDSYCRYKIIVDECNSESFYSSDQDHLFETDWLNDRCCPRRTPEMDVSGFETVRITIMWQFNPMNSGPVAFNIAIFNPILRAAKIHK
ncbi:MAG TPA: hypothetical protein VN538_03180 [Clostridia bacterium]|nr:hypothetical protein [Clostridia bacterium]